MKKILLLAILIAFTSCSKKITYTWNIDKYEIDSENGQNTVSKNIGTITFNKDNTGTKNINYQVLQNDYTDKKPFLWEKSEDNITIKSAKENAASAFDKTWIITVNKQKKQVWKSTDGKNNVQTIILSRK